MSALLPAENPLDCQACRLAQTRTQVVLPDGGGTILAVGEAPGADEDAKGVGFIGRAGKTLDKAMASVGIGRDDYARANVVRCRPPENRVPKADEKAACSPWLDHEISERRPRILLAVGESAAKRLISWPTGTKYLDYVESLLQAAEGRGQGALPAYRGVPVIPMPHTSGLVWNRRRPDGSRISDLGYKAIKLAQRLSEFAGKEDS